MSDDVFLRHAEELARRAEYQPQLTPFLTPAEQRELFDTLTAFRPRTVFWGGFAGAERRRAVFFPDWLGDCVRGALPDVDLSRAGAFSPEREEFARALCDYDGSVSDGFRAAEITGSGFAALSHRDYLGAVMRLGIERETVGDIAVTSDCSCVLFCTPTAAACITAELDRVGRDRVKVSLTDAVPDVRRRFEKKELILPSLRLDCAVKALCSLSREEAQRTVCAGLCELNYKVTDDVSRPVAPGDIISVRGYGKFRLGELAGSTRKDRIRMKAEKYI